MRVFLLSLLLTSCAVKHNHSPNDTKLDENKRDWLYVYKMELITAKENNDMEAWRFFFPEYLKELKNKYD